MNAIELFKSYVPTLDEVYKDASLTSVLDGNPDLAQAGANANELIIPMLDMQGLGAYSRNGGYAIGDVTLTNQTVAVNFDRGRLFPIDTVDNMETAGLLYARVASEFIRTKVTPELDAFRFATYASKPGIGTASGNLVSAADVIAALRAATNKMDEGEVPLEDRHLAITPTLLAMIDDLDTTKSKQVLARFDSIIKVPQTRFYTAITQRDGKTAGQEAGGFAKAAGAKNLNFLILQKGAVIQFPKHIAPKVIAPEQNQTSDGWLIGYRQVGYTNVYQNKLAGVYAHAATA